MNVNLTFGEWIDKAFDSFKKLTPLLLTVCIFSGCVLFLPTKILSKMALDNLSNTWLRMTGISFLISGTLILLIILSYPFNSIKRKINKCNYKRNKKKLLDKLSPDQKRILIKMFKAEGKVLQLNSLSGDVLYLRENNIIFQPQQVFSVGHDNSMYLQYTPHPWLIDMYNKNPRLLDKY